MTMPIPYHLIGIPPFYNMMMHPGMHLMPHPNPYMPFFNKHDLDHNNTS